MRACPDATLQERIGAINCTCYPAPAASAVQLTIDSPEFGNIVPSVFTPVLAKHTKSFNLIDTLSVGVDRIQRNFESLQRQFELWRKTQITDIRRS